ncbi:hypothetical protein ACA910_001890 [Epithemia clementina (nom. ined.)]
MESFQEIGGSFEDLRRDIIHEGSGRPAPKNHNLEDGCAGQEEGHGGTGAEGVRTDVVGVIAEDGVAAAQIAGIAEKTADIFWADEPGIVGSGGVDPTIHRGVKGSARPIPKNASDDSSP